MIFCKEFSNDRSSKLFAGFSLFRVDLNKVIYENNIIKEKTLWYSFFKQWEHFGCYIDKFKKDKISKLNNCDIPKLVKIIF